MVISVRGGRGPGRTDADAKKELESKPRAYAQNFWRNRRRGEGEKRKTAPGEANDDPSITKRARRRKQKNPDEKARKMRSGLLSSSR